MTTIRVVPATAENWPQLGRVFGPRQKDPNSCWCQRFLRHEEADNRSALKREVQEQPVPVGLLAYRDDDVVGWTRVVPRSALPGVMENRALCRILDDDPHSWWGVLLRGAPRTPRQRRRRRAPRGRSGLGRRARRLSARRPSGRHPCARRHSLGICHLHRNSSHVPSGKIHRDRPHLPDPPADETQQPAPLAEPLAEHGEFADIRDE